MAYSYVLTDDEQRELLRIARATLREFFHSGRIPPGKPHRDSLTADAGAFVSLHYEGALRGCIGTSAETTPLYRVVQEMTIAAASRDPRFDAITEDEVDDVEFEVSVLGKTTPLEDIGTLEIGTHGIIVEAGDHQGLLLPQVAVENKWDQATFVEHACTKAGLDKDAWKSDSAQIKIFTAQVFSDTTHPPLLRKSH